MPPFFASIIGVVSKVATTAYGIIKVVLPILQSLRPAVDEVDKAFDFIEEQVALGGAAADDFLDRNIQTIREVQSVATLGQSVFADIARLCAKLDDYSQVDSPDVITEDEAVDLITDLWDIKKTIAEFKIHSEIVTKKLEALA